MSIAGERARRPELPGQWERLERAVEDAAVAVASWRRRALDAEGEILRLRRTLEQLASARGEPLDAPAELKRLEAENAALRSRMQQARQRVSDLMTRLGALGVEP